MSHSIPVTLSQLAPFKVRPYVVNKDPHETYNSPKKPSSKNMQDFACYLSFSTSAYSIVHNIVLRNLKQSTTDI